MRFSLIVLVALAVTAQAGEIEIYQTPGNLQSQYGLTCIEKEKIKNIYTPADLYPAVSCCIKECEYEKAIYLYMVANAYGYYDAHRVADETAQQAIQVLQMNNLWGLDEESKKTFKEKFKAFANSEENMTKACDFLETLGKPNYHPTYMIQHGIEAFGGNNGDGLLPGADLDSIWNDAMVKYIKCKKQ